MQKEIKVGGVKNSENCVTSFMHDPFNDLKPTPFTTTVMVLFSTELKEKKLESQVQRSYSIYSLKMCLTQSILLKS